MKSYKELGNKCEICHYTTNEKSLYYGENTLFLLCELCYNSIGLSEKGKLNTICKDTWIQKNICSKAKDCYSCITVHEKIFRRRMKLLRLE